MSEQRLIDANALLKRLKEIHYMDGIKMRLEVEYAPTIDPVRHGYVLSSVHEQVQWERDIAIDQLHSYGVEFGEKAEIQRVRQGKWIKDKDRDMLRCSVCKNFCVENWYYWFRYCPHCGARMDKECE